MTYTVVAGAWTTDGLWTTDNEVVQDNRLSSNYILSEEGYVVARELADGRVVKASGEVPEDGTGIRLSKDAFKYWTVANAQAFERGEAVNPWLPKSNLARKN